MKRTSHLTFSEFSRNCVEGMAAMKRTGHLTSSPGKCLGKQGSMEHELTTLSHYAMTYNVCRSITRHFNGSICHDTIVSLVPNVGS